MAAVTISNPINIEFSVLDVEDYLPSFEMSIDLSASSFLGDFNCQLESVWFECSEWDTFVQNIPLQDNNAAILKSMCACFKLTLTKEEDSYSLSLCCNMKATNKGKLGANIEQDIDKDILLQINQSFEQFSKWW